MTYVKSRQIRPPTTGLAPDAETTPEATAPASAELSCATFSLGRLVLYCRDHVKPAPFPTRQYSIVTFISATARLVR